MFRLFPLRTMLFVLAFFGLSAWESNQIPLQAGQWGLAPVLDPQTYTSPSGEYALYIDPDDPHGRGSATYRLSRKGMVVWEGKRDFTLWEAGVTNEGVAGGYAYTPGSRG